MVIVTTTGGHVAGQLDLFGGAVPGSAHQHRSTSPAPRREQELTIAEAAARLGVKPDVI